MDTLEGIIESGLRKELEVESGERNKKKRKELKKINKEIEETEMRVKWMNEVSKLKEEVLQRAEAYTSTLQQSLSALCLKSNNLSKTVLGPTVFNNPSIISTMLAQVKALDQSYSVLDSYNKSPKCFFCDSN
jgi:hypothetical protein